jgi:hypothetical protein
MGVTEFVNGLVQKVLTVDRRPVGSSHYRGMIFGPYFQNRFSVVTFAAARQKHPQTFCLNLSNLSPFKKPPGVRCPLPSQGYMDFDSIISKAMTGR